MIKVLRFKNKEKLLITNLMKNNFAKNIKSEIKLIKFKC